MKTLGAALAACAALTVAGAAHADDLINYTFSPGSTYSFVDNGTDYTVSGGFTFNATTNEVSNVTYTATSVEGAGVYNFTSGTANSDMDIVFSGDGNDDNNEFFFATSLASGGADLITGGAYPPYNLDQENIAATGSVVSDSLVSAVSAAPEPGTWALFLGGVGMLGAAMRIAHARRREHDVKDIATA